jgi:hypothetical protein
VWTLLQHLTLDRQLGLDSFHYSHLREPEYPPSMGGTWESFGELRARLALEARILRANFPALREQPAIFEDGGIPVRTEAIRLDDPVQTFPKRCSDRFGFLSDDFGLRREFEDESTVLYIGADRAIRITLLETSYAHEEDAHPTLEAELAPVIGAGGELPPYGDDVVELDITERSGPFTRDYLEKALDELESILRTLEPQLRQRAHA